MSFVFAKTSLAPAFSKASFEKEVDIAKQDMPAAKAAEIPDKASSTTIQYSGST